MVSQLDVTFYIAELELGEFLDADNAAYPGALTPRDLLRIMAWDQFFRMHEQEAWDICQLPWEMDAIDITCEADVIYVPLAMVSVPLERLNEVPVILIGLDSF